MNENHKQDEGEIFINKKQKVHHPSHMMVHHFLLSELDCSRTGVIGSTVGDRSASSTAAPCFVGVKTPCATSRDVRSLGILDVLENHPPGKRREEVVDSRRLRDKTGDVSGERGEVVSKVLFSSRAGSEVVLDLPRQQGVKPTSKT